MMAPVTSTLAVSLLVYPSTAAALLLCRHILSLAATELLTLQGRLCSHVSGPMSPSVVVLCLASLVHHKVFLEDTLPAKHPLLSSVLFGDVGMTTLLRANVTLLSSSMQPTGIPPHVSLHTQLEKNLAAVRALPGEIRDGIESLLDEKGVSAGNITHALLEQLLKNAVASVVDARPIIVSTRSPAQDESVPVRPVHYWGGRWHLLAEDYELPSVDVSTGWHLWWCGSPARDIPPLYKI
ncbi:hypothetical protein DYB36_014000, partial [Aphanomyces astaci]